MCPHYRQTLNNHRRTSNGAVLTIVNTIGTNRNADFVFDIIESNLVNLPKFTIVTWTDIELSLDVDSDVSAIQFGRMLNAQYLIRMDFVNGRIMVNIFDVIYGGIILQETM